MAKIGMSKKEREFFNLYNSPDYYDKLFGCKTYHNAVMTYMVLNMKADERYKKYGDIIEKRYTIAEDGNIQLDLSKSEYVLNNFDEYKSNSYGNFYFKDHVSYLEVLSKANEMLGRQEIQDAMKDLTKKLHGGLDQMREKTMMTAYDISQDTNADSKTRNEALKLVGNWLGIEKTEQVANVNVVLSGIDAGLKALEDKE